jgi:pimeloyl-ACP methyl ester carboxylesterase
MPFIPLTPYRLHYLEEGSGPPLVWLPGGNDCAALMLHAHRPLTRRVRLICIDPRGQGESHAAHTPDEYAPAAHVGDLERALDALGLERVVIGGHSRGGRTALEFSLARPERVVAAIAAASPLQGVTPERSSGLQRLQRTLAEQGVDAFLGLLRSAPRHPERHALWRAAAHRAGATALIAQYEALLRLLPLAPRMSELRKPVLLLAGDRDPLAEHSRVCAEAGRDVRFVEVPDAGHGLFADNAPPYLEAINRFLDEVW